MEVKKIFFRVDLKIKIFDKESEIKQKKDEIKKK